MTPLITIRPEPGCTATVSAALAMGLSALGFPLFAVRALPWQAPPPDAVDALLLGSANALRHGGNQLALYRGKPAHVVGEATARAAAAAGLAVASIGQGGLQSVLGALPAAHRRLLRLAGRDHVALALPGGHTMTERVVYASEARPMAPALADRLARPAVVLLHSAEAARHFAAECDRLDLLRGGIMIAALAPRVAEAAGQGWRSVIIAPLPHDQALLATARAMCQEADRAQTGHDISDGARPA